MDRRDEPEPGTEGELVTDSGLRLPYVDQGDRRATNLYSCTGSSDRTERSSPRPAACRPRSASSRRRPAAAVVVGHSMGAVVAQRLAVDRPDRTRALVLLGACSIDRPEPPAGSRAFYESTVRALEDPTDRAFLQDFLRTTVATPLPEVVAGAQLEDARKVPARGWRALLRDRLERTSGGDLGIIEVATLLL